MWLQPLRSKNMNISNRFLIKHVGHIWWTTEPDLWHQIDLGLGSGSATFNHVDLGYFKPQVSLLWNRTKTSTSLIGLVWSLKEIMHESIWYNGWNTVSPQFAWAAIINYLAPMRRYSFLENLWFCTLHGPGRLLKKSCSTWLLHLFFIHHPIIFYQIFRIPPGSKNHSNKLSASFCFWDDH